SRQSQKSSNRLRPWTRLLVGLSSFDVVCQNGLKMGSSSSNKQWEPADRITPRYLFEARIRVCVQRGSQKLVMEGWARDLSESGLSAFVARDLIADELVTLDVPLGPARGRLRIPGKVVRCLGTQYGFRF